MDQNEFNLEKATEEERTYVKHLLGLASNAFDESDWRLKRMFVAVSKKWWRAASKYAKNMISMRVLLLKYMSENNEYFRKYMI